MRSEGRPNGRSAKIEHDEAFPVGNGAKDRQAQTCHLGGGWIGPRPGGRCVWHQFRRHET